MAIVYLSPDPQSIADCKDWLQDSSPQELNRLYQQFWGYLSRVADDDSEEAYLYWTTIFAIEDIQQYQQGEVNKIRFGQ